MLENVPESARCDGSHRRESAMCGGELLDRAHVEDEQVYALLPANASMADSRAPVS